jgi:predicted metalloprotease with PDZ domain
MEVRIVIDDARPTVASVEGRLNDDKGAVNLSFLNSYGGVGALADRFSEIRLADSEKRDVEFKRLQPGEYLAERNYTFFAYKADLRPRPSPSAAAHISWLGAEHGILALDDLLPQPLDRVALRLRIELPRSWRIITNEDRVYEDVIDVHDAQRSVILVGRSWRLLPVSNTGVKIAVAGDPQITDADIADETAKVRKAYLDIFGNAPSGPTPMIAITSFPVPVTPGNWEAETRGSVITIATSGGLSPVDSRQRLRQQLRHEAMHLWLPNAVNLTGNYDWFYEGFATYEEQKLGVAMNHMRFDDLLATLARAYDVSRFSANGRSLVDASRERWSGANSQVYARGLTLAFLIDIAMLDASKGKRSVETLMREIFEKHKPPAAATNANDAVIAQMRAYPEVTPLVERHVTGAGPFDWSTLLQKAGLTSSTQDQLTRLAVVEKPTGRQKDLLDKLGYNNWRKLAAK